MNEDPLTSERILEAAEDVLRRFGPAKATVVDVARVLDVSHGSVYRHFPSKAALRDDVTKRWLARMMPQLEAISSAKGPATERLYRWLTTLMAAKRSKVLDDPELFATYVELASEARVVVQAHVDELISQIEHIVIDGVAQGEFVTSDTHSAARSVLYATTKFHNPAHAAEWSDPNIDDAFEGVWTLILSGLTVRTV